MKKTGKKKKDFGHSGLSVTDSDATDTQWLDAILEHMNSVTAKIVAYRAAHPSVLSVPDAWTMKEFLANAKQVYRVAHLPHLTRGRRSEENAAIDHLSLMRSHELGPPPTQGAMIKWLIDELKLSKNTAGKYAKLYRLSRQDTARFSQAEQRWLRKNFGSESLTLAWWDDRRWGPWMSERLRRSGVGEEIRKLFAGEYTEAEMRQTRAELVIQMDERIAEQSALRRQKTDVTIAKDVLTKEPHPRPTRSLKSPG